MANKSIMNENNQIESGLRADVMRKSMENKNLLNGIGKIYVGTNEVEPIEVEGQTLNIPITTCLDPGSKSAEFGYPILVSDTLTYPDKGLGYRYIKDDMLGDNPRVFNKVIAGSLAARLGVGENYNVICLADNGMPSTSHSLYLVPNSVGFNSYTFCNSTNRQTDDYSQMADIKCDGINCTSIGSSVVYAKDLRYDEQSLDVGLYTKSFNEEQIAAIYSSMPHFGKHVIGFRRGFWNSTNNKLILGLDNPKGDGVAGSHILRGAYIRSNLIYGATENTVTLTPYMVGTSDPRFSWYLVNSTPQSKPYQDSITLTLDEDYLIMPILTHRSGSEGYVLEIFIVGSQGTISYGYRDRMNIDYIQGIYLTNSNCAIDLEEILLQGANSYPFGYCNTVSSIYQYGSTMSTAKVGTYNPTESGANLYPLLSRSGHYLCLQIRQREQDYEYYETSCVKIPLSEVAYMTDGQSLFVRDNADIYYLERKNMALYIYYRTIRDSVADVYLQYAWIE